MTNLNKETKKLIEIGRNIATHFKIEKEFDKCICKELIYPIFYFWILSDKEYGLENKSKLKREISIISHSIINLDFNNKKADEVARVARAARAARDAWAARAARDAWADRNAWVARAAWAAWAAWDARAAWVARADRNAWDKITSFTIFFVNSKFRYFQCPFSIDKYHMSISNAYKRIQKYKLLDIIVNMEKWIVFRDHYLMTGEQIEIN